MLQGQAQLIRSRLPGFRRGWVEPSGLQQVSAGLRQVSCPRSSLQDEQHEQGGKQAQERAVSKRGQPASSA